MGWTYSGRARVLDLNGMLIDVGKATLADDPEQATWTGTLRVFHGSSLASKSLTTLVELDGGVRVRAQVGPQVAEAGSGLVDVKVVGLDPAPH